MADEKKTILIDIQSNLEQYRSEAEKAAAESKRLKDEIKQLEKAGGDNTKAIEANKEKLRQSQKEYREATKNVDLLKRANESAAGSYDQLAAEAAIAEKELKKQSGLLEKNADGTIQMSDAYVQAAKKAGTAREAIIKFDQGINNGKTNVGLYGQSIKNAIGGLDNMPGALGGATKGMFGMVKAMWAIVMNPVGLIIAAIVGAVMLLVNIFKSFEPVVDAVDQAMAALAATFTVIKQAIVGLFTGTTSLSEAFSGLAGDIEKAAIAAMELKKAEQELDDFRLKSSVNQAKYKRQIDEAILQSKDRTKSEEERVALIEEALAIEEKAYNEKKRIADENRRLIEENIMNGRKFTDEEKKNLKELGVDNLEYLTDKKAVTQEEVEELAKAIIAQEQILNESVAIREKALNRQNVLLEKSEAEQEKIREKAKTAQEKADAEALKAAEKLAKDRATYLEAEAKAEEAILNLKEQLRREARQKRIDAEAADKELDKQQMAKDIQDAADIAILKGQTDYETKRIELETRYNQEIAATEKIGNDTRLIEEKYSLMRMELVKLEQNAKLSIMGNMAGQLADLFGKETAIGKAAAVTQATISTWLGAQAAFTQGMTVGGPILAYANAAVAVATGLMNVKKILAVNPKGGGASSGGSAPSAPRGYIAQRANGAAATSQVILPQIASNIGASGAQSAGASVQAASQQNSDIVNAIKGIKPVVTVEEFTKVQNRANQVEVQANY